MINMVPVISDDILTSGTAALEPDFEPPQMFPAQAIFVQPMPPPPPAQSVPLGVPRPVPQPRRPLYRDSSSTSPLRSPEMNPFFQQAHYSQHIYPSGFSPSFRPSNSPSQSPYFPAYGPTPIYPAQPPTGHRPQTKPLRPDPSTFTSIPIYFGGNPYPPIFEAGECISAAPPSSQSYNYIPPSFGAPFPASDAFPPVEFSPLGINHFAAHSSSDLFSRPVPVSFIAAEPSEPLPPRRPPPFMTRLKKPNSQPFPKRRGVFDLLG
jgi:hypothetical protein